MAISLAGDGPMTALVRSARLHHPLRAGALLPTPILEIDTEAMAHMGVQSEGVESPAIKTQAGPVVKASQRRTVIPVAQGFRACEKIRCSAGLQACRDGQT
jgi:hypothetical protein